MEILKIDRHTASRQYAKRSRDSIASVDHSTIYPSRGLAHEVRSRLNDVRASPRSGPALELVRTPCKARYFHSKLRIRATHSCKFSNRSVAMMCGLFDAPI